MFRGRNKLKSNYPVKITQPDFSRLLNRERLFKQLDSACDSSSIVWISAPGGSGKTSLVSSYLKSRNLKSIWYQVDEADNVPATFFHYMGLAGKKAAPRKPDLPQLTPEYFLALPTFTLHFFESITDRLKSGGVIVMDNTQFLSDDGQVAQLLESISNTVANSLTLIMVSRYQLPAYLMNLRAQGRVSEITMDTIRFNESEWLSIEQNSFDETQTLQLHKNMDGWVAGLMLCQNRSIDSKESIDVLGLVNESLFDYFAYEFFSKLDNQSQQLLIHCCYLDHFNEAYATQLSTLENSSQIIKKLLQKNVFIQRQGIGQFVLHPLFQTFLQSQAIEKLSGQALLQLKLDSAYLLADQDALEHAALLFIELEDWPKLADFILEHAGILFQQGRIEVLSSWLNTLPIEVMNKNNGLLYWETAVLSFSDMPLCIKKSVTVFDGFILLNDIKGAWQSWLLVMQLMNGTWAESLYLKDWLTRFEQHLNPHFSKLDIVLEAQVLSQLTFGYMLYALEPEKTELWLNKTDQAIKQHSNENLLALLLGSGIFVASILGYTRQAKNYLSILNSLTISDSFSPIEKMAVVSNKLMGESFIGNLHISLERYQQSSQLSEELAIKMFDSVLHTMSLLSSLALSKKQDAQFHLKGMEKTQHIFVVNSINYNWGKALLLMFEQQFEAAQQACEDVLKAFSVEAHIPVYALIVKITHIESLIHQGKDSQAQPLLKKAEEEANTLCIPASQIRVHLLKAYCAEQKNQPDQMRLQLSKMFELAKKHDLHVYPGWVPGLLIAWACEQAIRLDIHTEFVTYYVKSLNGLIKSPSQQLLNWPWLVRIHSFGDFKVSMSDGQVLSESKQDKRELQLLKLLLVHSGEASSHVLCEELYPDLSAEKQSNLLRKHLHRLRLLLGHEQAVVRNGSSLAINLNHCWVDYIAFEQLMECKNSQEIELALNLYKGEFMSDTMVDDFEFLTKREHLRGTYLRLVLSHLLTLERKEAIQLCHTAIRYEPLTEVLYQKLIALYLAEKRPDLAQASYRECYRVLDVSLGIEPLDDTKALLGLNT